MDTIKDRPDEDENENGEAVGLLDEEKRDIEREAEKDENKKRESNGEEILFDREKYSNPFRGKTPIRNGNPFNNDFSGRRSSTEVLSSVTGNGQVSHLSSVGNYDTSDDTSDGVVTYSVYNEVCNQLCDVDITDILKDKRRKNSGDSEQEG